MEVPAISNKQQREINSAQTEKAKAKLSYMKNRKFPPKKLLELINEFSKVAENEVNTQKSVAFLYTSNEQSKKEIKKTIPFTTASKRIKYLGIYQGSETFFQ